MAILTILLLIVAWSSLISSNKSTRESINQLKKSNEALQESNRLTNESLTETKKELKVRLIPLLKFADTQTVIHNQYGKFNVRFTALIRNNGTVPARKVTIKQFKSNNTKIDNLVKEINNKPLLELGTIQHDNYIEYLCDVPWGETEASTNWIVWFEYAYLDISKEYAVAVFEGFTGGRENLKHQWYVHEDVIEAIEKSKNPPSAPL